MSAEETIEDLLRRVAELEQRVSDFEALPESVAQMFRNATPVRSDGEFTETQGALPLALRSAS